MNDVAGRQKKRNNKIMDEKPNKKNNHQKIHLDKDINVLDEYRHELSGARLVLAETKKPHRDKSGTERSPCYVLAWVAPWQKTLRSYILFYSKGAAEKTFRKSSKKAPPGNSQLCRDWQVSKVYDWEEEFIDKGSPELTPKQMERVVRRISSDFNMVAPKIKYKEPGPEDEDQISFYYEHLHSILMQHNKLSAVIHEVAHAIDMKLNGNSWAHHGPSFVRTLIYLAARYQYWHSPRQLEKQAEKAGIMITPRRALPNLPRPK